MKNIRLLPVVVMAIAALLVLKTIGLVTNGGYVLTGVSMARAAGGGSAAPAGEGEPSLEPATDPTLADTSPTLPDGAPTLGEAPAAAGGHGAPAPAADHGAPATETAAPAADHGEAPPAEAAANPAFLPAASCFESDATIKESGEIVLEGAAAGDAADAGHAAPSATDCLPSGDAIARSVGANGAPVVLDGASVTEQQLLERLAARRAELQQYEQDLALRASIVNAAEKRIEERATTLQALETQISSLVDQRTEMESGQFAGIVSMYEAMKPKDAANIFNNLDMDVLLRVAKTMSPRKMAPILAEMTAARAQELTVKMAGLADQPAAEMTPADLAALPQIVGQ